MRSKIFSLFFLFLMVAVTPLLASCISYVYPHGQWVEPVDLAIHATSLDGIPIKVICSDADGGNISEGEGCVFIKKIVANMGAVVEDMPEKEDSDTESPIQSATKKITAPEILVTYQEIKSGFGMCGWSLVPMIASGFLFPCLAEVDSSAKLTVTAVRGNQSRSWPLMVHQRKYFGIGALFLMLSEIGKPVSRSAYRRQQSENFAKFIENKVYTASALQGGVF